ncbi:MAG TPA: hypothetical protein VHO25_04500 [Polyangiaceae bacterium]|nr:hypothetical protein [Polyangiaceae bacterium]
MSDKGERQRSQPGWYGLFMYTVVVLAVGVLLGHFLTMCPTQGLRMALYPWWMIAGTAGMALFGVFLFGALGFELTKGERHDN